MYPRRGVTWRQHLSATRVSRIKSSLSLSPEGPNDLQISTFRWPLAWVSPRETLLLATTPTPGGRTQDRALVTAFTEGRGAQPDPGGETPTWEHSPSPEQMLSLPRLCPAPPSSSLRGGGWVLTGRVMVGRGLGTTRPKQKEEVTVTVTVATTLGAVTRVKLSW